MFLSTLDTYYAYVTQQMSIINNTQAFGGMVQARDWPNTEVIEGALYLLVLNSLPVGGTEFSVEYNHFVQWVWLVIGSNIEANTTMANRGDRYRTHMTIEQNLRDANYPGFTQRISTSLSASGVVQFNSVAQTPGGLETVKWTRPKFMPKQDVISGLIYGAAAVEVHGFEDVNPLVA